MRSFIDASILAYSEASDEPAKQRVALDWLRQLFQTTNGVLPTQVLQKYCNVAIKKLKLPPAHIRAQLDLHKQFEVVQVTPTIIRMGLDLHQMRRVSFL